MHTARCDRSESETKAARGPRDLARAADRQKLASLHLAAPVPLYGHDSLTLEDGHVRRLVVREVRRCLAHPPHVRGICAEPKFCRLSMGPKKLSVLELFREYHNYIPLIMMLCAFGAEVGYSTH